jgi:hypothetical protein
MCHFLLQCVPAPKRKNRQRAGGFSGLLNMYQSTLESMYPGRQRLLQGKSKKVRVRFVHGGGC